MSRQTITVTNAWQQIAVGIAVFTIQGHGEGPLLFNETASDINAIPVFELAGKQMKETEPKSTFVRAKKNNAGWIIVVDGDI